MKDQLIWGFGDRSVSLDDLQKRFPTFQIQTLRQTHSDIVVEAPVVQETEGDALITLRKNLLLVVKSADCLPILIWDHSTSSIAAIHAGWRGVANGITVKCLQKLKEMGTKSETTSIFIGPHISKDSFECGKDIAEIILKSIGLNLTTGNRYYNEISAHKCLLDLQSILLKQINASLGEPQRLHLNEIDTVTNKTYHSFRRDKETAGRNLSYIGLI